MSVFDRFGADAIYARNRELAELLRRALADCGWAPLDLQEANRSAIVSVPLGDTDPAHVVSELRARGVVCSARDGHLRLTVHFYNHEDDIERLAGALSELGEPLCDDAGVR
jgi:selenocysteine lyase/cysteine desulfurase